MRENLSNATEIARQLKKGLKEILKKSDRFYLSLKDIALDDEQNLKQKVGAVDQLLKLSQEKWLTQIKAEEKFLFPLLRSKMPKVKESVSVLQEKCKAIKVNFEVVQYLCWELRSKGSGMKRSVILQELKTNSRKLVLMIDSYLNLETKYINLVVAQV